MPRVAPRVPELSEILCSSCGYVLNGLDEKSVCPECGQPILLSLDANRIPPAWESANSGQKALGFLQSTRRVILQPKLFYRTLTVRGPIESAAKFAKLHWLMAAILFGLTGATHATWFSYIIAPSGRAFPGGPWGMFTALFVLLTVVTYFTLDITTRLAGRLTTWEATYRGLRLPYPIVLRGLYYHAAHYLPVALTSFVVVEGYQLLVLLAQRLHRSLPDNHPMIYLYTLCGLVVLAAGYLFQTYWIGMRNMMYANR